MSNLVEHARRELERFETDQDYINGICNVMQAFSDMGPSGGMAAVAIPQITALLQFKNLGPLTEDPSEWMEVGPNMWQSTRNSEAFSEDGGKFYYLLSNPSVRRKSHPAK